MTAETVDLAIVGGGIVGLGTALALADTHPGCSLAILEKEDALARHQTGHNSGVIHAGIYYKPGSFKAKLCVEGVRLLKTFCAETRVPFEECGKLIVATTADELPRLQALYERGVANGIQGLEIIGPERVKEIEPHARALKALYSPSTAIVDYTQVAAAMGRKFVEHGGRVLKGHRVSAIHRSGGTLRIDAGHASLSARKLINCAGLYADDVARLTGNDPGVRIIPFRGEYFCLRPECRLVRGLIYPVPDPQFPFLGVHFTKRIGGDYEAGPNAVLAFAREGYRLTDVNVRELLGTLGYRGFWAMARRHWKIEAYELYRSVSRKAFLKSLRKLVPDLQDADLDGRGSGVRAQCLTPGGNLVDDFHIVEAQEAIHVLNAPSPAATASLAIGRHVAALAAHHFGLK
jgi:(S)-2-hydroxyglutarate dehydrogenase